MNNTYNIIVHNLENNIEKTIDFYCSEFSQISIGDSFQESSIQFDASQGNHQLKVVFHHDFFIDWYIDDSLVEECVILNLISDENKIVSFKSNKPIELQKKSISDDSINITEVFSFPVRMKMKENLSFIINCSKGSQLSFFFEPNENDFHALTLQFNENFCKVYSDEYQERKFVSDSRENLSLFETKYGLDNIFKINIDNKKLHVTNEIIEDKEYDLTEALKSCEFLDIQESYMPSGPGQYTVKEINLSNSLPLGHETNEKVDNLD